MFFAGKNNQHQKQAYTTVVLLRIWSKQDQWVELQSQIFYETHFFGVQATPKKKEERKNIPNANSNSICKTLGFGLRAP